MRRSREQVQREHGERISARQAINGQPNGYKPISEAELQASKAKPIDLVASIMAWEGGEMNATETCEFFQHLVKTGMAWQLQGIYGRTAAHLLETGQIHL